MKTHEPKNERIKRKYRIWLQEAKQMATHSIDQTMAAIALFERETKYKDFASFNIEWAREFKASQLQTANAETGKPLAKATVKSRLDALKAFIQWISFQPGYKARIKRPDAEYFNMSANDSRIATAKRERPSPDLDQVHFVIASMKADTPIEKRNRALIAFAILTGARDNAIASFKVSDIDMKLAKVFQDARHVRTKFAKSFETTFFPVGGQAKAIFTDWIGYLKTDLNFGPDDPLFPQTDVKVDPKVGFMAAGLKREFWGNADAIRRIFKQAFEAAGLPYYNPHSFRKTLVRLGLKICRTQDQLKAWSQNLGHEDLITTMQSYGKISNESQAEIMRGLGEIDQEVASMNTDFADKLRAMAALIEQGKKVA